VRCSVIAITGAMAIAFAFVHLFIGMARFLHVVPRSRWLSASGGAAAAYVFLHILPELGSHEETFRDSVLFGERAEIAVHCVALAGLTVFYGLERAVRGRRRRVAEQGGATAPGSKVFWIHIGSFCLYNVLIGYLLLHREETGSASLVFYFVAMLLHFATSDFGLRQDHAQAYDRRARWLLSVAVMAGWLLGLAVSVPEVAVGLMFSFLAGGVVLNVLKEELPEERQSRFVPFLLGATLYAALLLAADARTTGGERAEPASTAPSGAREASAVMRSTT
jgi:hypothetical protein